MPTKQVTIIGVMTWADDAQQPPSGAHPEHPIYNPPGIWGPTDPRPTHPISGIPGLPGGPGQNPPVGAHPMPPIYLPDYIWGPTDPRPTNPISGIPGLPGYEPPKPGGGGGSALPPAANVPIKGYIVFIPGYGWMFIPEKGQGDHVDNTLPGRGSDGGEHPDNTLPGSQPKPEHPIVNPPGMTKPSGDKPPINVGGDKK